MKKVLLSVLLIVTLISCTTPALGSGSEKKESNFSLVMAINEPVALKDGKEVSIAKPLNVFGKTYVDIYSASSLLGLDADWVNDGHGYLSVSGKKFKGISTWEDLSKKTGRCFTKDSVTYASLRELVELTNYNIKYKDGIITVGESAHADLKSLFGSINTSDCDYYVYTKYPNPAGYVVNPYCEYSYEYMINDAKRLKKMYPELIKTSSIGKSVENRDLLLIEFGRGPLKIFVCGTHHAREYISTTYLMYAIDRYSYAYRNNTAWGSYSPRDLLDKVTFCIVPMVNPDGVNLVQNGVYATTNPNELINMGIYEGADYGYSAWKANIRGVDVNWNYNKDWYLDRNKNDRGSTGFNGYAPNTEPETAAVSAYVDSHEFEAYLSFHTQGQIFYWADSTVKPTGLHHAIERDTGFTPYRSGDDVVGGSFFDYVYRKYNKPTITVELCPYVGNYPYPDANFDIVWSPARNILLVTANELLYVNSGNKNLNPNNSGKKGLFDRVGK